MLQSDAASVDTSCAVKRTMAQACLVELAVVWLEQNSSKSRWAREQTIKMICSSAGCRACESTLDISDTQRKTKRQQSHTMTCVLLDMQIVKTAIHTISKDYGVRPVVVNPCSFTAAQIHEALKGALTGRTCLSMAFMTLLI